MTTISDEATTIGDCRQPDNDVESLMDQMLSETTAQQQPSSPSKDDSDTHEEVTSEDLQPQEVVPSEHRKDETGAKQEDVGSNTLLTEGENTVGAETTERIGDGEDEVAVASVERLEEAVAAPVLVTESGPAAPSPLDTAADTVHQVKWVTQAHGTRVAVVTQNENGPCPLLAVCNVLLQRGQMRLPNDDAELVTARQLMEHLGDCLLRLAAPPPPTGVTRDKAEQCSADYEQNVSDAVAVLPKLMTGLDVNVRFTGVSHFEYTPECVVFDLLGIPLYHGWLVDPQDEASFCAVGTNSYNSLVEMIIAGQSSSDGDRVSTALAAEHFLDVSASQLTYHGLCELNASMRDTELAVFFRNNHFSTLLKHRDELFLLVTDQGFIGESKVVWETLNTIDGDSHFVDAAFHTSPLKLEPPPVTTAVAPSANEVPTHADGNTGAEQIDRDYLMALSLEQEQQQSVAAASTALSDEQLARQIQQQENDLARQQQQPASPTATTRRNTPPQHVAPTAETTAGSRRNSGDRCAIL